MNNDFKNNDSVVLVYGTLYLLNIFVRLFFNGN